MKKTISALLILMLFASSGLAKVGDFSEALKRARDKTNEHYSKELQELTKYEIKSGRLDLVNYKIRKQEYQIEDLQNKVDLLEAKQKGIIVTGIVVLIMILVK